MRLNKLGMGEPLEFSFQEITFIFVESKANLAQSSFNLKSIKQQDKIKKYAGFFPDTSIFNWVQEKVCRKSWKLKFEAIVM